MRVLVISDTHFPSRAKQLPARIIHELGRADYLIHAGDFVALSLVELLEKSLPFAGVAGNNDSPEIEEMLGNRKQFNLAGYNIGVVHGDVGPGRNTLERAMNAFKAEKLDILVFGHSHIPYLGKHRDTWVLNPGSPTDKRNNKQPSFGLVELGEQLIPELIFF